MRVTDLTLADQLSGDLGNQQATITNLDEELSSGIALQRPSDDPVAVVDTLSDSRQIAQTATNEANASAASAWLGLGNQTANQVISSLQTVQSTVLQSLNSGANNAQSYSEMALQVQGVMSQMVGLANTTYGTTPIFAGTAGVSAPYSPTGTYSGNANPFTIAVGNGAPVAVSVPGTTLFGGGSSGIQSVFATLQNIMNDLNSGPGSASYVGLQTDLNDLNSNITQAETAATQLGASSEQVTAASTAAQDASTQLQTVRANTEDADIPTVTAALQSDLTNYQAALYAVAQTVPETLAQFLK